MPTPPRTKRVTKTSSAKKPSRLKNTLQKAGSMTMLPYLAKAAGKDRLADAMGYPIGKDGKIKPELEFKNSAENLRKRGEKAKPIGEKTVKRVSSAIKAAKNKVAKKASGGSLNRKSPDGIATRGKTRLSTKGFGKIG